MEKFFGFDLGDAESAVSLLKKDSRENPEVLTIAGVQSLITAYARLKDRSLVIGENACYHPDANVRKIRFKSRFLTDPEAEEDVKQFAAGVLGELLGSGDLIQNEDACFYIGCPAGWNNTERERYRQIFARLGYPPLKIVSESRAALVAACRSKHLQVGYDILQKPVLVVDVGSSTTDFAYVKGGKEVELKTAGEVRLGGGLMDRMILEEALSASPDEKKLRQILAESEPWQTYCEFAARRLKEKYFSSESYWKENDCTQTVRITYDRPRKLTLRMNEEIAARVLSGKNKIVGGNSFEGAFKDSLAEIKKGIDEAGPELLFLTGGVSKMPQMAQWCREIFPDTIVITSNEPEFSVSRGLAWCGQVDEEVRGFREEIDQLKDSSIVERIVGEHIEALFTEAVDTLTDPILEKAVLPVIERWRDGEIEKLSEIDKEMEKSIESWLHTQEARALLAKPVSAWLKPIAYELEEYTVPICLKHKIPYRALNLSSYLSEGEMEIQVEAKDVFAVEEITWMIDMIISVIIGLLCGGSGIALISNGLPGMLAGMVVSLLVLLIGKKPMEKAILNAKVPKKARKLLTKGYLRRRVLAVSGDVKSAFYDHLKKEKNEEIAERMTKDISLQIDECLVKMAQVVEIPLH